MKRLSRIWLVVVAVSAVIAVVVAFASTRDFAVLNPEGTIADQQRNLMIIATLLMLIVVIPVFIMTFFIIWKYREGNTKARYEPEWDSSKMAESIWWGFPLAIIAVLSVITFISSHKLDPFKPIESTKEPVRVQVVALQWKWLFMYPEYGIASVNYLQIPEDRPVNFEITADAPMNSLWIPQLGGQIYAMAGMNTKLHLMADNPGSYYGSSANLSGRGFAGMNFTTQAVTEEEFDQWVAAVQSSEMRLDNTEYKNLSQPSENIAPQTYLLVDANIYNTVLAKYASHDTHTSEHGDNEAKQQNSHGAHHE